MGQKSASLEQLNHFKFKPNLFNQKNVNFKPCKYSLSLGNKKKKQNKTKTKTLFYGQTALPSWVVELGLFFSISGGKNLPKNTEFSKNSKKKDFFLQFLFESILIYFQTFYTKN